MPVGFGKHASKNKGRTLSVMAYLKHSIVEVKAEENCLEHAFIIAISRLEKGRYYNSYRRGNRISPVIRNLCKKTVLTYLKVQGSPK